MVPMRALERGDGHCWRRCFQRRACAIAAARCHRAEADGAHVLLPFHGLLPRLSSDSSHHLRQAARAIARAAVRTALKLAALLQRAVEIVLLSGLADREPRKVILHKARLILRNHDLLRRGVMKHLIPSI